MEIYENAHGKLTFPLRVLLASVVFGGVSYLLFNKASGFMGVQDLRKTTGLLRGQADSIMFSSPDEFSNLYR